MATREDVYCKFGLTAEAAQLFETDLGTVLLAIEGLKNQWHIQPDPRNARKTLDGIESQTLGRLLEKLKQTMNLKDEIIDQFASALKTRNRLFHGFFEGHNFKIQTDEGRDLMIADLEKIHQELFASWQVASTISKEILVLFTDSNEST